MLPLSIKHHGKKGITMSEPRLEDDEAAGKDNDECKDCGNFMHSCACNEPDRMYGDEN